ncbi:MAG: hypothetical protein DCC56_06770 [Anaerolineae bacterium]|nr:MAG: hypothetical protein DCC56_06770 [Anaerolineae bacterium]WKZ43441.1 MAG: NBR1-Ig-like domain-containing protein [Anaerolineales bacterium]
MYVLRSYKISVVLLCLALSIAACAPSTAQSDAIIATSVALTVEAGKQALATNTPEPPLPTLPATLTPAVANTPTEAPTLSSAPSDPDCIHAVFVSEYPPDQAVFKPGADFSKTWTIRNVGTCTWDYSYKLIFWSGDAMGGATYYNLAEIVPPGDDIPITVQLKAPEAEGFYTGYWRLQTPWNKNFGVGQYSQAFYATIQVDKRPQQESTVLSVTYNIVREPATGCPANVKYTVYATITTNGPYEFSYYWEQKDGNESGVKGLDFDAAGSQTVSREWVVGRGDSPNDRWMQIIVVEPELIEFDKAVFSNPCP